jgi:hypothetical protein
MNNAELMRRKHAVVEVTSRPGWHVIRAIAEDALKAMCDEALDEEDDVKGSALRREAKAARKFLNQFLQQVEIQTRVEVPEDVPAAADQDYEVACD